MREVAACLNDTLQWNAGNVGDRRPQLRAAYEREYFFGAHDENRVEFTLGRDLALNPKQMDDPLNYFIYPYAEADGKALNSIDKNFAYRDAPVSSSGDK